MPILAMGCKQDRGENKVSLNSVTYLYYLKLNCVLINFHSNSGCTVSFILKISITHLMSSIILMNSVTVLSDPIAQLSTEVVVNGLAVD